MLVLITRKQRFISQASQALAILKAAILLMCALITLESLRIVRMCNSKVRNHRINVCFWETANLPLPKPNINTSRFGQNFRFGEGYVRSLPETYIDLNYLSTLL